MGRKRKIVLALILLVSGSGLALAVISSSSSEKDNFGDGALVEEIRSYQKWQRVNPEPLELPALLDLLCRMPTKEDLIETSRNPHRRKFFTVYVNETGRGSMLRESRPRFPTGSIIVKEKLLSKETRERELLTVMVKREPGFNKALGDWEFMVVNESVNKIEGRGRLENCQSCHQQKSETDFVFRTYLPEKTRLQLQ